jgi:hypothetical protein
MSRTTAVWRHRLAKPALVVAGYLCLLMLIFHEVWRGQRFFGWDCLREYWPDMVFGMHAIADGEMPLWNPFALGGYSYFGDSQAGLLAPVNWLLWILGWIFFGDGPWMIQAKVFINLLVGLVGMHAFVKRRTGLHSAAAVAALIYVLGSPLLVHKNGAFLWPFLYLPWAALALERFVERSSVRRGLILGAALWLCGSAGHPQGFFYGLVILASYWAFLSVREGFVVSLRRQLVGGAAAVVSSLLFLLPIYLPNAQAVAHSVRAERTLGYVLQVPIHPRGLAELLLPNLDANWQLDVYVGLITLALACLAVLWPRKGRAEAIFWWALGAVALLLALGKHAGLLELFYKYVPGFSLFRVSYRHKLIFGFAIAVLAGDGVAAIAARDMSARLRSRFAIAAAAYLGVLVLAYALWLGSSNGAHSWAAGRWALILGGLAATALVGSLWAGRFAPYAMGLVCVLVAADLWVAGGSKIDILQKPPDVKRDQRVLQQMPGNDRFFNDKALPYHIPYVHERRAFSGFLNPVRLGRHEDVVKRLSKSPGLLSVFGVRWYVGGRPPPGWRRHENRVWENPSPVPMVRAYSNALAMPDPEALKRLQQRGELQAALVAPGGPSQLPGSQGPGVTGELMRLERNRVEATVTTEGPAVVVINEPYFPGWTAQVNGEERELFRVNYLMRGVLVDGGESSIVMRFRPLWYYVLLLGFLLAIAAVLVSVTSRARVFDTGGGA